MNHSKKSTLVKWIWRKKHLKGQSFSWNREIRKWMGKNSQAFNLTKKPNPTTIQALTAQTNKAKNRKDLMIRLHK